MADNTDFVADTIAGISPAAKKPAATPERAPGQGGGEPTGVLLISKVNTVVMIDPPRNADAGGTITLKFGGLNDHVEEDADVDWVGGADSSAAALQAALESMPSIEPGDVHVTRYNNQPYRIEFQGQYAAMDVWNEIGFTAVGSEELPDLAVHHVVRGNPGDVELFPGFQADHQRPLWLYKQGGRVYLFGRIRTPDSNGFSPGGGDAANNINQAGGDGIFTLPEGYRPHPSIDPTQSGDWEFVESAGDAPYSLEFYWNDDVTFGLFYIYDADGSNIAPDKIITFTNVSWPAEPDPA